MVAEASPCHRAFARRPAEATAHVTFDPVSGATISAFKRIGGSRPLCDLGGWRVQRRYSPCRRCGRFGHQSHGCGGDFGRRAAISFFARTPPVSSASGLGGSGPDGVHQEDLRVGLFWCVRPGKPLEQRSKHAWSGAGNKSGLRGTLTSRSSLPCCWSEERRHGAATGVFVALTGVRQRSHGSNAGWHSGCHCAPLQSSARRRPAGSRTSPGADATPRRSAPAAPRRDLQRPAVPDGAPRTRPDLQPGGGLTKTDQDWAVALETALTATRRDDIKHGTTAAYIRGCVCSECREHQRRRMAKNRK